MIGQNGRTPPAPWVTYTRAGCNVGSVAAANTELENQAPDVANVFGANSPDAAFANNPDNFSAAEAYYMGLSIHCAKGDAVCADNHSVPDVLKDEPGGYHGYQALFGARYIDPVLAPGVQPVTSTSGIPVVPVTNFNGQVIEDSNGDVGFPGYDSMQGYNALAYTLDMQTHGVPVTYTYLTDVHDSWTHMITGDPKRPPSVALFGNPDFWYRAGSADCGTSCFSEPSGGDAWNHGDVAPEINTTSLGHVGELYKQLDAPVGAFGRDTLKVSTVALASRSPSDATYTALENQLSQLGNERDSIASAIQALLLGATFDGQPVNAGRATGLINAGEALLARAAHLAG